MKRTTNKTKPNNEITKDDPINKDDPNLDSIATRH